MISCSKKRRAVHFRDTALLPAPGEHWGSRLYPQLDQREPIGLLSVETKRIIEIEIPPFLLERNWFILTHCIGGGDSPVKALLLPVIAAPTVSDSRSRFSAVRFPFQDPEKLELISHFPSCLYCGCSRPVMNGATCTGRNYSIK